MSILVVEDYEDLRELLVEELEGLAPVLAARNGHDAIELIHETRGIRAIVSDLELGGVLDGFAVLRTGRARHPACTRVLVTGRRDLTFDPVSSQLVEIVFAKPWVAGSIRQYLRARLG